MRILSPSLSDSDSDFEKFFESHKQKRKKSVSSAEEVKKRTKKTQKRRPPKLKEHSLKQYRDKESLDQEAMEEEVEAEEVIKPAPPRPRFKPRPSASEQSILEGFVEEGMDREDVQMFKLALARLKGEGDHLVEGLPWAHYPHNILS